MKFIKFTVLFALIFMTSCSLDPGYTGYSNVLVVIDEKTVPPTGTVDVPLSISAHCYAPNGCWSNLEFLFGVQPNSTVRYELFAIGDYLSYGECPEILVTADTTISFTPTAPGQYIIQTWLNGQEYDLDTIIVTPSQDR